MINLTDFSTIFVANWKLNGNIEFIDEYFKNLINNSNNCVVICPPIIYANKIQNKNVGSGQQKHHILRIIV